MLLIIYIIYMASRDGHAQRVIYTSRDAAFPNDTQSVMRSIARQVWLIHDATLLIYVSHTPLLMSPALPADIERSARRDGDVTTFTDDTYLKHYDIPIPRKLSG